jgi:hypothetical protein
MAKDVKTAEPDASAMPLQRFFTDNWYAVPPYQRDYTWGRSEVSDLLRDILDFSDSGDPYYMIGQVIVAPYPGDEDYELVDGQQRCTTLFLVAIALYRKMPQITEPGSIEETLKYGLFQMIKINEIDKQGWRIRVASTGPAVVEAIFSNSELPISEDKTTQNLKSAYSDIEDWVDANLSDPERLNKIVDLVQKKIWLTRLKVEGRRQAVIMYERINNRGKDLDGSDLIKNLLFASVDDDQFEDVSSYWNKASKLLSKKDDDPVASGDDSPNEKMPSKLSSIQYLLRALLVAELGRKVQDADVYPGWDKKLNKEPLEDGTERNLTPAEVQEKSLAFAHALPVAAQKLKYIATERAPLSGQTVGLMAASRFFNSIQQYPVLLAGANLNDEMYRNLVMRVESRILLGLLAKERNQDLEVLVPKWASSVSKLPSDCTLGDLDEACRDAMEQLPGLVNRSSQNFVEFNYSSSSDRNRIRLVLGRATVYSQKKVKPKDRYGIGDFLKEPKIGGKRAPKFGWDLDHVFSQAGYSDHKLIDNVGNLVLTDVNQRGAGKKAPEEKVDEIYASSSLALTRSLCSPERLGGLSKVEDDFYRSLVSQFSADASNWSSVAICERTRLYWNLFIRSMNEDWSAVPVVDISTEQISAHLEKVAPGWTSTEEFEGSRYFRAPTLEI